MAGKAKVDSEEDERKVARDNRAGLPEFQLTFYEKHGKSEEHEKFVRGGIENRAEARGNLRAAGEKAIDAIRQHGDHDRN